MIVGVRNIDTHVIEVPFEFQTYTFPVGKIVTVSRELHAFLEDRFPLAFAFSPKITDDTPAVESVKTKAVMPTKEEAKELGTDFMRIHATQPEATFSSPDGAPPSGHTDKDGVEWYGEGIQPDTV